MITTIEHPDKKEAILAAAETLFVQHGFDAVSVRDLAKEANVNIAMISYYFGSKEKLFEALLVRRIESSYEVLRSLITPKMNGRQKMNAIIDHYVDKLIDNRNSHRMMNREMSGTTRPLLRDMIMDKIRMNRIFIRDIMEEGIKNGEFNPHMDIDMTIMNFFATLTHTVGASYYSCSMFNKPNDEELFTPEFKARFKKYFKDLFSHNLL